MLTAAQISAGNSRLSSGKLTAADVDQAASILSMDSFFGGLVEQYGYDFKTKLAEFDDVANPSEKIAAQIAGCLVIMEDLGFGVARKEGGPSAIFFREKEEYWQYVQIIFLKMYKLPKERSTYPLSRRQSPASSGTAFTERVERSNMDIDLMSERRFRRGRH